MKNKFIKKIALGLVLGASVVAAGSLTANAAIQKLDYNLTPPGWGIQRDSDSAIKQTSDKDATNKCTKTQNDHVLQGWIEKQSDGGMLTPKVKFATGQFVKMHYYEDYNQTSVHFSVEVDSTAGYNTYGYWSPDTNYFN